MRLQWEEGLGLKGGAGTASTLTHESHRTRFDCNWACSYFPSSAVSVQYRCCAVVSRLGHVSPTDRDWAVCAAYCSTRIAKIISLARIWNNYWLVLGPGLQLAYAEPPQSWWSIVHTCIYQPPQPRSEKKSRNLNIQLRVQQPPASLSTPHPPPAKQTALIITTHPIWRIREQTPVRRRRR